MPFDSPFGQFMSNVFGGYDQAVFSLFGHLQNDFLTWINIAFSALGTELFVLLIGLVGVVLCFFRRTRKLGLLFVFAGIFTLVICGWIINPLANRLRPYNVCQTSSEYFRWYMNAGTIAEGPYSFPSKHSAFAFCISVSLLLMFFKDYGKKNLKVLGIVLVAIASFVSMSRVYLMVHYPTDVLAGILIGILLGVASFYLTSLIVKTLPKWRKPFHWMDKVDLEPLFENKILKRKIDNKKFYRIIVILVCCCFIGSLAYLVYGINGGEEKCQYRDNNYTCMNKADDQVYNENSGQFENRCKIHKHM